MSRLLDDWFGCCAFAPANPAYFCALAADDPHSGILANLRRTMALRSTLWGDPARTAEYCGALPVEGRRLEVRLPRHVFPVFLRLHGEGMIVPLEIGPARNWEVSDAFGTFAVAGARSPNDGFLSLLGRLDGALDAHFPGFFPLRWRRPFSLRIACALHFDSLGGESLQLPLLVALLREAASRPFSNAAGQVIPFGEGPVFSSGVLLEDGSFHKVGGLVEKLGGYRREFPTHARAILTRAQCDALRQSAEGRTELSYFAVHEADNLGELVRLPEFKPGLEAAAGPPHPTEIDRLFDELGTLARSIQFRDVERLADRLLPHAPSGPYRLRLLVNAASARLHGGSYVDALRYLGEAEALMDTHGADFGADDRAALAALAASALLDAAEPEHGIRMLERANPLDACTLAHRVRVLGTRSQLERMLGHWDVAVSCAEDAVRCADLGFASEAGRDRNYLVHALLRRAAAQQQTRAADLARAAQILAESSDLWAPRDDPSNRSAHLGFCQQYESELARLLPRRHQPAASAPWHGPWEHPRIFVLLGCARNPAHEPAERLAYARACEAEAAQRCKKKDRSSVFHLIHLLTQVYRAGLEQRNLRERAAALRAWCQERASGGLPGWSRRLDGPLTPLERGSADAAEIEQLVSALPYL